MRNKPETDIMDQFLDPETDLKHQFLDPESVRKCQRTHLVLCHLDEDTLTTVLK